MKKTCYSSEYVCLWTVAEESKIELACLELQDSQTLAQANHVDVKECQVSRGVQGGLDASWGRVVAKVRAKECEWSVRVLVGVGL